MSFFRMFFLSDMSGTPNSRIILCFAGIDLRVCSNIPVSFSPPENHVIKYARGIPRFQETVVEHSKNRIEGEQKISLAWKLLLNSLMLIDPLFFDNCFSAGIDFFQSKSIQHGLLRQDTGRGFPEDGQDMQQTHGCCTVHLPVESESHSEG